MKLSENEKKAIDEYCKARDEAIRSMDVEKFKDFVLEYNGGIDLINISILSDEAIEIAMRKMAVHITTLDVETRVEAFRWLLERGHDFSF